MSATDGAGDKQVWQANMERQGEGWGAIPSVHDYWQVATLKDTTKPSMVVNNPETWYMCEQLLKQYHRCEQLLNPSIGVNNSWNIA